MEQAVGGYREWRLGSPLVRCAWSAAADQGGSWLQPASEFWGLGFSRSADVYSAALVGPVAGPTRVEVTAGSFSWGIELQAHVFPAGVVKPEATVFAPLPVADGRFRLGGRWLAVPEPDQLAGLVRELARAGIVVADDAVGWALAGGGGSGRTLRRRVRAVVGLNRQQVASVRRARAAFALLSQGVSILEVVERLGYADQSHLTRAMRALAGRTPREILTGPRRGGHIVQDHQADGRAGVVSNERSTP